MCRRGPAPSLSAPVEAFGVQVERNGAEATGRLNAYKDGNDASKDGSDASKDGSDAGHDGILLCHIIICTCRIIIYHIHQRWK